MGTTISMGDLIILCGMDLLVNLEEDENPYAPRTNPPQKKPPSQTWDNRAHLKRFLAKRTRHEV